MKKLIISMMMMTCLLSGVYLGAVDLGTNTVCPSHAAYWDNGLSTVWQALTLKPYGTNWNKFSYHSPYAYSSLFNVVVNNYTGHTFYFKGGETGENDGNFTFRDEDKNSTVKIGPNEINRNIFAKWKVVHTHINDCCEPEIAVELDDCGYGDWQDFGEVRLYDAQNNYACIGLNIWNNKYSFKVGNYYCTIFGVDNNTIQINFDNAGVSNSNSGNNHL